MKLNEFENKHLQRINKLDKTLHEGLGSTVLNLLFRGKFKRNLKAAAKLLDDDPELKAAFADFYRNAESIEDRYQTAVKQAKAQYRARKYKITELKVLNL